MFAAAMQCDQGEKGAHASPSLRLQEDEAPLSGPSRDERVKLLVLSLFLCYPSARRVYSAGDKRGRIIIDEGREMFVTPLTADHCPYLGRED